MSAAKSSVERSVFQAVQGEPAELITLRNANGALARITTYGATLTELHVPDRDGELKNIVLGYTNLEGYKNSKGMFGATVGRYAGRISGARFSLDGVEYVLFKNCGESTLHGGLVGFDKRIWKVERTDTTDGAGVTLAYTSEDMEEGFPGRLEVHVSYKLTDSDALAIEFIATTNKPTPVNLTNHTYFNLNGDDSKVRNHSMWIDAEHIAEVDANHCPTGKLAKVAETTNDFRTEKCIESQIERAGYDTNFCFSAPTMDTPRLTLHSDKTGIVLTMFTNQPGVQIFSGSGFTLDETFGKYGPESGLAIETQAYPDSVNIPEFPNTILRPGETYSHRVRYEFGLRD